jgi:hypothetical protein
LWCAALRYAALFMGLLCLLVLAALATVSLRVTNSILHQESYSMQLLPNNRLNKNYASRYADLCNKALQKSVHCCMEIMSAYVCCFAIVIAHICNALLCSLSALLPIHS